MHPLDALRAELVSLHLRLAEVDQKQRSLVRSIEQDRRKKSEMPDLGIAMDLSEPSLKEEERAKAQAQAQVELMETSMVSEVIDPEWKALAELALQEVFLKEDTVRFQLMKVECRATICRINLLRDSSASLPETFQTLLHFSPWQGESFFRLKQDESDEVVVYLSREGHPLP